MSACFTTVEFVMVFLIKNENCISFNRDCTGPFWSLLAIVYKCFQCYLSWKPLELLWWPKLPTFTKEPYRTLQVLLLRQVIHSTISVFKLREIAYNVLLIALACLVSHLFLISDYHHLKYIIRVLLVYYIKLHFSV